MAELFPEPCSEVAEHQPGFTQRAPTGRGMLTVQQCHGEGGEP